ncbi:hypothetical protein [Metabacillus sp. Hm71]|uniref:hypothetical protein n=1 Tax=Metabacillus sp. Hm71 TaxID=3450743 RepID=UPI003F4270DC
MTRFFNWVQKLGERLKITPLFTLLKDKQKLYRLHITLKRYRRNVIKKKFFDTIYYNWFILYAIFIIFYFFIPSFTSPIPEPLKQSINDFLLYTGFQHFNDATVKYIITTTTNLLVTVLSILSAMYVFTHREQKSISPSLYNETKKNGLVVLAVTILIFTMITGHTLSSNIESFLSEGNTLYHQLHYTKILIFRIMLWVFLIFLAIMFVILLIKYLFDSMNADKMLKTSISLLSDNFDLLTAFYKNQRFYKLLDDVYKSQHHNIESTFQYLKFLGDNNMNRDFDEDIDRLSKVIEKLKNSFEKLEVENPASYLLDRDRELFLEIYNSLLRNTLSLTLHLYKNNHFNKGKKLTNLYFSIFLGGEGSLKQYFTLSLNEFLDSLDTSNERQVKHFLNGLKKLPEESTLIIYKNLIQRLIIKGNISLLTTVVYDFKEHITDGIERSKSKSSASMFKAIAAQNQIKMKQNAIIILLQLLVKAIEISQYGIAGFLVKYMITNFDGKDINEAYKNLRQNPTSFTSILETLDENVQAEDEHEIGLIGLNAETFDYCCKKMLILLYGQQQFAITEKLWFVKKAEYEVIDLVYEFKNCPYIHYVMKKVLSASSQYGMLFFNDPEIMKDIHRKLNIEHHYPDNEHQKLEKSPQYTK